MHWRLARRQERRQRAPAQDRDTYGADFWRSRPLLLETVNPEVRATITPHPVTRQSGLSFAHDEPDSSNRRTDGGGPGHVDDGHFRTTAPGPTGGTRYPL